MGLFQQTVLLSACFALVGCGGGTSPVPVQGIVLRDGQPFAGAMIRLVSDDPKVRPAHAFTRPDGRFSLETYKPDDGAIPGEYKVVITYIEPTYDLPPTATQEETMRAMEAAAKKRKQPLLILPETYTDPTKTKLRLKVPPEGEVKFEVFTKG